MTLLNIDYEAIKDRKGWDAAERLSQIINRMEEWLKGIRILQCRYPNREGQMKSRWLSKSEWLQNKVILHAFCSWTFLPIKIESPKNSIKPEDQRYVYRVQVDKSAKFENVSVSYLADITTVWDGRIISIHVGGNAKYAGVDFSSIHLIADLADQVEYKRLEQHDCFLQEEWQIADPLLKDFIKTVKLEAEHFHHNIDEIDLEAVFISV